MSMMMRRKMMVRAARGLPAEYQRVEYIEGTGTQYIATNYVPATDYTDIDLVCAFTQSQTRDQMLFGSRKGSNDRNWQCEYYDQRSWYISNGIYKWRSVLSGSAKDLDTCYRISIHSNTLTVDDFTANATATVTGSNNYPMYIFAWNNAGNAQYINIGARIYSLSFTENGKLAANFVPCYRKSDSKPGMYDTISRTFYTNAGSEEFVIGSKSDMTGWANGVPYTDIEVVSNSYYRGDGVIVSYNGWDRTGKIPIHGAARLDFAPFNGAGIDRTFCHFFDKNGTTIGKFTNPMRATGFSEPVPNEAWYFGISSSSSQIAAVLESGITPYA